MIKKGDTVEWQSHGNSYLTVKTGQVVYVLPPKTSTVRAVLEFKKTHKIMFHPADVVSLSGRDHESYLVSVSMGNAKPRLYWPIVRQLRKVK